MSDISYLSATALCYNKLQGAFLCFNNLKADTVGVVEHVVAGADSETQVWNVTVPSQITKCASTLKGDSLRFKEKVGGYAKYVAFNPKGSGFLSISGYSSVANQNLHAFKGADLIVLSPVAYMTPRRPAQEERRHFGRSGNPRTDFQ